MLNQILQTFLLCLAAMILAVGIALVSPLPSGILVAQAQDRDAEIVKPAPSPPRAETPNPVPPKPKEDRAAKMDEDQPMQADPSVPYDPYDINAIRKMDREIYGEVKGKNNG
jgi:hypothetical protein